MKKKIAIMRSLGCLVAVVIFMIVMPVSICASADLVLTRADYNMGIAVEDTCHIGRYTAATYDGTMLLDDYPNAGTSYTTIRIDGYDYCQDDIMDPYVLQKPTKSGDSIVTKWLLAPYVTVSQNITLMQNTMQYQLVVANIGYASHSVKVRALFDVALGDSDDALCWVPVAGEITTEREFKDLDYWRTKSSHDRSSFTSNCTFAPDNRPDKVLFASWEDVYNNSFDYTISKGRDITSDTAVAMYWDLGTLASGETKSVTFYFGIESRPIIPPHLELEITGLFTESDNYTPTQSVKLHANVENDGDAPLTNGQLAISILNPNGEKVFENVSTIAINPNQTISPCFTYYVPVNALNGVYTINATIYNAEMILLDQREATFAVYSNISITDLFPPDEVILSSNDVLFSWTTNENSTTEVYIKPETESGYIKVTDESGLDHEVIVANLTRGVNYTWYAKSSTPSGSGISDNRTLYIYHVIAFTEDEYAFTVARDHNQCVNVSVKNTDSEPHEVLVTANSDYEDIFVGFVGAGSEDMILSLNPGETGNVTLVINAQVSELEDYAFTVSLTNLDAGNLIDSARILLSVRRGANIIYVPDDYPKIQTAVDAASPGDTIIVRDGTYTENIAVNKSVTIMSENGAESSIVQAECSDDHIIEVTADYVNISGFTVRSVRKSHDPTIQNAGIYLKSVVHCCISDNIATSNDFGILLYDSSTNALTNNTAKENDAGIILFGSSRNVFYLNNFIDNTENVRSYNSTNIWNSSSKMAYTYKGKNYENYLGNYWDDHEENDADEDGIWDTPYRIDLDNDLYPLMLPCTIYFKPLNDTESVKSNCETISTDQIMAGAKLIEKVETNAIVNLNGIIYDFNATLQGDYAVWEEELDDYIYKGDTYHGVAGYNKSPVIVKIAVSKDGLFLLGTFNGTAEDNLVIFAQNRGLTNYRDFMGNLLDKSQYGVPHDVFLDLDARQNILAYIFGEHYKYLYNRGCIWSGPKDYNELYNCDYTLENRFDLPISVIRLYLLHDQRKDWMNEKYRPIREARNAKWSPSGNKPNPNSLLSRNFNVNYQSVNGSFVWMQTHADNGLQSEVTIYRMDKPPDYSCRGGDSRSWQVKYDLYAESYTVHNVGCAVAELFLCDQPPNRVQMEVYTPHLQFLPAKDISVHGNIEQSVTIAVLGYITTSNSLKYLIRNTS